MFYGSCLKICEDFTPNFGDKKKNWLLYHNNTPLFTREFFTKNNMTLTFHPPYSPDLAPCDFFLFPKLKIKLKGHHSATEAELWVVLNTFTEHNLQNAFKKWQTQWEQYIHVEVGYFKGDGGQLAQS
jgi:hypothetical protein